MLSFRIIILACLVLLSTSNTPDKTKDIEEDNQALKIALEEYKKVITKFREESKELKSENEKLNSKLKELQLDFKNVANKALETPQLETEVAGLKHLLKTTEREKEEINEQTTMCYQDFADAKKLIKKLEKQNSGKKGNQESKKAETKLRECVEEKDMYELLATTLREDFWNANTEIEDLKSKINEQNDAEVKGDLEKCMTKLGSAQKELSSLNEKSNDSNLQEEVYTLMGQVTECEASVKGCTDGKQQIYDQMKQMQKMMSQLDEMHQKTASQMRQQLEGIASDERYYRRSFGLSVAALTAAGTIGLSYFINKRLTEKPAKSKRVQKEEMKKDKLMKRK